MQHLRGGPLGSSSRLLLNRLVRRLFGLRCLRQFDVESGGKDGKLLLVRWVGVVAVPLGQE